MADAQMVDPHDVVMTGENSFIRLSNDGGKTIVDRVSHWRVLWSTFQSRFESERARLNQ